MDTALFLRQFKAQPTTKAKYKAHLQHMIRYGITLADATPEQFESYLSSKGTGNADQRQALAALQAYRRWADVDPLDFEIPKDENPPTTPITPEQVEKLVQACYATHYLVTGDRNKSIVLTLNDTWVRSSELGDIRLADVDLDTCSLKVRTKAKARKPRHWEKKKFSPRTARSIQVWLDGRDTYPTRDAPYLFLSRPLTVKGKPVKDPGRITRDGLQSLLNRLGQKAGFHVHPHMFRAGGATAAIERGLPDRLVMAQGGWNSYSVFKRYTENVDLNAFADQMWG